MTNDEFSRGLDALTAAGWSWESRWIGPIEEPVGARMRYRRGRGAWVEQWGKTPAEALAKTLAALGIDQGAA